MGNFSKNFIKNLLVNVGIEIGGSNSWDIKIHNEKVFDRVLADGSIGAGETYMDGWWDCDRLDMFFDRVLRGKVDQKFNYQKSALVNYLAFKFKKFIPIKHLNKEIRKHYDLGNELFKNMLDKHMMYSCAYWKEAETLDEAQEAKLKLIGDKLKLEPGMKVLDIGCGWGGLAKYLVSNYDVNVVGVTISEQQYAFAKENCKEYPVEIRLQDYRDITEVFDRIVSVGMFEHVGAANYKTFMSKVSNSLINEGLFLLHTIGSSETQTSGDPWVGKYIFPNSLLPSVVQIAETSEEWFVMEDWQNFGPDYDKTLLAWHKNFNNNWHNIKKYYDERFFRMWNYYLLSCAATFRARQTHLWQIVFSKGAVQERYDAPR